MGWQSENTPVQIYAQNELKLTLFGGVEKQVNIYLQLSLLQASKVNFSLSCSTGSCHFQCLILIAINMSSSKPHNKPPYCFEMAIDVISKSDISILRWGVALQAQAKPYPWMKPPKLPLPLMLTLTLNPTKPKPKIYDLKNVLEHATQLGPKESSEVQQTYTLVPEVFFHHEEMRQERERSGKRKPLVVDDRCRLTSNQ